MASALLVVARCFLKYFSLSLILCFAYKRSSESLPSSGSSGGSSNSTGGGDGGGSGSSSSSASTSSKKPSKKDAGSKATSERKSLLGVAVPKRGGAGGSLKAGSKSSGYSAGRGAKAVKSGGRR